jgi:hypothetical protein
MFKIVVLRSSPMLFPSEVVLLVAMGDCWAFVEQEGKTENFDVAVEDQSSNAASKQHDGDEFNGDNIVEV